MLNIFFQNINYTNTTAVSSGQSSVQIAQGIISGNFSDEIITSSGYPDYDNITHNGVNITMDSNEIEIYNQITGKNCSSIMADSTYQGASVDVKKSICRNPNTTINHAFMGTIQNLIRDYHNRFLSIVYVNIIIIEL